MRVNHWLFIAVLLSGCNLDISGPGNLPDDTDSDSDTGSDGGTEPLPTPVEQALASGDFRKADAEALNEAALTTIAERRTRFDDIFDDLNEGVTSLDWNPTHDAAALKSRFGYSRPVLQSNAVYHDTWEVKTRELAIAGTEPSRYLVMGGNPFRNWWRDGSAPKNEYVNADMHQWLANGLNWLIGRTPSESDPARVVMAQMDQSYYFPDAEATEEWLDERFGSAVTTHERFACDGAALSGCLNEPTDLLIVSQKAGDGDVAAIQSTVESAMAEGVPVLYLHLNGNLTDLGEALLDTFNVDYHHDNYWHRVGLKAYDPAELVGQLPPAIDAIQTLLTHWRDHSFSVDLATCQSDCDTYQEELGQGLNALKDRFNALDQAGTRLFGDDPDQLWQLLALWGDAVRDRVQYDTIVAEDDSIDRDAFVDASIADYSVYLSRDWQPVPQDLGNFSRTDFSHVTPGTYTTTLTAKRPFRATGAYVLPGQTVTVTRLDNEPVDTTIFVNSLRSGSTHEFDAYNRPKFLKSERFTLKPDQPLTFSSPYGGPVQISFSDNDMDVELRFEGVGQHPYWSGTDDNASFTQAINQGDYDWAELATPGFEIHSTLGKMRDTIDDWSSPAELAETTRNYTSNYPHVLAGFQGPGVDWEAEIQGYIQNKGWTVHTIDQVKHMNADQATCGYGCSGNPYDAYWAFSPLGHGDIHELGHGLEKWRFRFEGWPVHASTNFYAYFTKWKHYDNTGAPPSCQNLPFETHYNHIAASQNTDDPAAYMRDRDLTGWSDGAALYVQLFMAVQQAGVLNDGWHLLGRLHGLERQFNWADNDETRWLEQRDSLGFSQYTHADLGDLSKNDWLLIALSTVAERNLTDWLRTYGFEFTDKARSQVSGLTTLPPRVFTPAEDDAYCTGLNQPAVDVEPGMPAYP